jgi:hypothetical protein
MMINIDRFVRFDCVCAQSIVLLRINKEGGLDLIVTEIHQDTTRNEEDLTTNQDSRSNRSNLVRSVLTSRTTRGSNHLMVLVLPNLVFNTKHPDIWILSPQYVE